MKTFLAALAFLIFCTAHAETKTFKSWDEACAAAESTVAEGDIIFLDIDSYLFRQVAAATLSWTAHVGTVFKDKDNHWIVSESTIPRSTDTELCDFLQQSSEFRFQIKRLNRSLTSNEILKMREYALSHMKIAYDLNFNFDNKKLFCSKMVYLIFQTIGVTVGKVQTFRELLSENPEGSQTFWRVYFGGKIPWKQRTVTPASQNRDPQFSLILDAF